MDENSTSIPDPLDSQETVQMPPADDTLTTPPVPSQPNAVSMDRPQRSNTSNVPILDEDDQKEDAKGDVPPGTNHFQSNQRNTFLFLALVGFFLGFCFDLLGNTISLPSWMDSIGLFLVIASVALLMLLEAIRVHPSVNSGERRAFLKHSLLSGGTIILLTILGSFLIIAHAKTNIHLVEDLKGKRFALVDPNSTSGRLIPLYELKKAGLDPGKDIDSFYAGSHTNVLEKVLSREVPAGAVASSVYQKYLREGKFDEGDLVILVKSRNIPTGPFVVREDIQPYDELRIKDAFLTVAETDPSIISTMGIGGFAKAVHKDYEFLLETARELGISISEFDK